MIGNGDAAVMVRPVLDEYGALTRDAMQAYLEPGEPRRHLYDPLRDYPKRGGKMMRPSLCIATARAFGASIDDALRSAVAIELLHNALLIHDDIEDESEQRRGAPTLHELHGIPIALNAGDMLAMTSLRPLIDNVGHVGPWLALQIVHETERMARESAEGQAIELGWRRDNTIELSPSDYLVMVLKKTCWLAAVYPSRIGAMIGTKKALHPEAFVRFGFFMGAAFQIHDDVLNLLADLRYGKERCGDVWEAKRTLMLIYLLQDATPRERTDIRAFLAKTRRHRHTEEIVWICDLMEKYGCIARSKKFAHGLAGAAMHEFAAVYDDLPDSRDKRFIRGLITWVFERNS
ncbi:MAG: polyprenyl synthetase family protein [Alphaproteobacteria bacterium]